MSELDRISRVTKLIITREKSKPIKIIKVGKYMPKRLRQVILLSTIEVLQLNGMNIKN